MNTDLHTQNARNIETLSTFDVIEYFALIERLKPRSQADEKKVYQRFLYAPQRKRHNGAFRLSDAILSALQIQDPTERLNALKDCEKTLHETRKKLGQKI